MYSVSSVRAIRLISLPFRSLVASWKSKMTEACLSLRIKRSCLSEGEASGPGKVSQCVRTIKVMSNKWLPLRFCNFSSSTRSVTWKRELRCRRGVFNLGIVSLGVLFSRPRALDPLAFDLLGEPEAEEGDEVDEVGEGDAAPPADPLSLPPPIESRDMAEVGGVAALSCQRHTVSLSIPLRIAKKAAPFCYHPQGSRKVPNSTWDFAAPCWRPLAMRMASSDCHSRPWGS